MNTCPKDGNTGQVMIESNEKDPLCAQANIKLLLMMRFFLVEAPPVLTLEIRLGNLCNAQEPYDFKFNDLNEILGKCCSIL